MAEITTTNRKSIATTLFCVTMIAAVVLSVPCHADEKTVAKATFSRAVELFAKDDYRGALVAFEDSYRIYPRVSTLFNIGMCQKALLLYRDAIDSFDRFLLESTDAAHPEHRRDAKAALEELVGFVSKLHMTGVPNGSTLRIDGRKIGKTPLSGALWLDPGNHSVVINHREYQEFRTEVTSSAGIKTELSVVLQPNPQSPEPSNMLPVMEPKGDESIQGVELSDDDEDSKPSALRVTGTISSVIGLGFVGFGVYNGVKYNQYYDRGISLDPDESEEISNEYDDLKFNKQPTARNLTIIGYSIGGALIITGATLIIVDIAGKKRVDDHRVSFSPAGVSVKF